LQMKESVQPTINQQTRMQMVGHSALRNHTVYYVRQPLGSQDFRQSTGSVATSVARSFPDVHEIRRLDGIRAPIESPGLIQAMNHANTLPEQPASKSVVQHQSKDENRSLKLRRDESDDPTFGFSRRPAVKVVTNATREFQTQSTGRANQNLNLNQAVGSNSHPRLLVGSQTLDRKSVNRIYLAPAQCPTLTKL
jgi:ribosomal protein L31